MIATDSPEEIEPEEERESAGAEIVEALEKLVAAHGELAAQLRALVEKLQPSAAPSAPPEITFEAAKPVEWQHEAMFSDGRRVTMTSKPCAHS